MPGSESRASCQGCGRLPQYTEVDKISVSPWGFRFLVEAVTMDTAPKLFALFVKATCILVLSVVHLLNIHLAFVAPLLVAALRHVEEVDEIAGRTRYPRLTGSKPWLIV